MSALQAVAVSKGGCPQLPSIMEVAAQSVPSDLRSAVNKIAMRPLL
jgi:hypothetical protein